MIGDEITKLGARIEELRNLDLGYSLTRNSLCLRPAAEIFSSLKRYTIARGLPMHSGLLEFYEIHNGLWLPNLHNGYFLHSAEWVVQAESRGVPIEVSGDDGFPVLVFGTDGGGGMFAYRLGADPDIVHLSSDGAVWSNVYDIDSGKARIIANDFADFLAKLANDIDAFVRGDEFWTYMTDDFY